jgi:carbonic anhydrase/acetyltransferase-like protein (isoleucine patch superfamily)
MRRVQPHLRPELIHPSVFIAEGAVIRGDVTLAEDVSVWFNAVLRGDVDSIEIGSRSNVQDGAVIHCDPGYRCVIEEEVTIGHAAVVHGAWIKSRVLIGIRAVVLNGAQIGEGSIIGAGAVVTEGAVIPPNSLVVGVPAKVIRETSDEQRAHILRNALNYVESGRKYREANHAQEHQSPLRDSK